jgi:hypothetical protein
MDEEARQKARDLAETDAFQTARARRKKIEMLFAHLKRWLKLTRLRLRGLCQRRCKNRPCGGAKVGQLRVSGSEAGNGFRAQVPALSI